jgi:hypothetical protein
LLSIHPFILAVVALSRTLAISVALFLSIILILILSTRQPGN